MLGKGPFPAYIFTLEEGHLHRRRQCLDNAKNGSVGVQQLVAALLKPESRDAGPLKNQAEQLKRLVKDCGKELPSEDLRHIVKLPERLSCLAVVSKQCHGCYEGTSYSEKVEREIFLADLTALARKELLRRGEPEILPELTLSNDELHLDKALSFWKRKTMLKSIEKRKRMLDEAAGSDRTSALMLIAGAMQSPEKALQKEALKAAGHLEPLPGFILRMVMETEDPSLLFDAVRMLEKAPCGETAALLGEIVRRTTDRQVRSAAIDVLGGIRHPESTLALTWLYNLENRLEERLRLLEAAGETGGDLALQLLTGALADRAEEVFAKAASILEDYGKDSRYRALAASISRCSEEFLPRNLLVLGETRNPEAVDIIAGFLEDPSTEIRVAATIALGANYTPKAAEQLISALKSPDSPVRLTALEGVKRFNSVLCRDALAGTLAHSDPETAVKAAEALCETGDVAVPDILAGALTSRVPALRFIAAGGLLNRKDPRGLATMAAFLTDGPPEFQSRAIAALVEKAGEPGLEAIALAVDTAPDTLRGELARVFADKRYEGAVPALVRLLDNGPEEARPHAAAALKRHGWKPDNPSRIREYCVQTGDFTAMAEAGMPEAVEPLLRSGLKAGSDYQMISCSRNLEKIKTPAAVDALIKLMNSSGRKLGIFPAFVLLEMDDPRACRALVDNVFSPNEAQGLDVRIILDGKPGLIRWIMAKAAFPEHSFRAVKMLERILEKRPSIVTDEDLAGLCSLQVQTITLKSKIEACRVVVTATGGREPLDCARVRRLASEERLRRQSSG